MPTSQLNHSRMNRLFENVSTRKDGRHEPMSTSALARATGLKRIAAYRHLADMEARAWIQSVMGQVSGVPPACGGGNHDGTVHSHDRQESAHRLSDCVTALLRDQPFFGSLALRLPIRADASRETIASDGHEIRYSPQWVADTDADLIKTAIGRVVLACTLKHHTRRASAIRNAGSAPRSSSHTGCCATRASPCRPTLRRGRD